MKSPDDLDALLHRLRDAPTPADPDKTAFGFETRLAARLRADSGSDAETVKWFGRWSVVFGLATAACLVLTVQAYSALSGDVFAAFEQPALFLDWML